MVGLGREIEEIVQAGRAAWPDFAVPAEEFARHVERHAPVAPERAADLYLAFACARGDARAHRAFDALLAQVVARSVARIDASKPFADAVTQDLRARLFMGDAPAAAEYAGRAPLASWLRTSAVRAALNARRGKQGQPHDEIPSNAVARGEPELEVLRARYRGEFEGAVRDALRALAVRDRELLAASLRDRMNSDDLAAKLGVGRSTANRWLIAARDALTRETRRLLQSRLGLTESELESVANVVRSEIDVSVVRLLGE